jgi:glycerophosphoryl diester phosphodiesterase
MTSRTDFTPLAAHLRTESLRIAHRGASAYAPENSLQALVKAAELGADMVELDLRATVDHHPVLMHDPSLKRLYGVDANLEELTLADLHHLTTERGNPIPTFEMAVQQCRQLKLGLYLDIKQLSVQAFGIVIGNLVNEGLVDYTIAGSFRPDYVAEIKVHYPLLKTSILFSSIHIDPVALASAVKCDYVHPCWENVAPQPHQMLIEGDWLGRVRGAGLGVICWHEERLSEIAALKRLGVDGICSDTPERLLSA